MPTSKPGVTPLTAAVPQLDIDLTASLIKAAVARCRLDLTGLEVLTEAATGAYAVTPVIAAFAGAEHVTALTKDSRYGSVGEVTQQTFALARLLGVAERIEVVTSLPANALRASDVVTNSGHLRPIDGAMVTEMRPGAIVSLMYEAWERRPGDIDIAACEKRGVKVVATNEQHPEIDTFSFLGEMAMVQIREASVDATEPSVLVLCDNPFAPYLNDGLTRMGCSVRVVSTLDDAPTNLFDVLLVALKPSAEPVLGGGDIELVSQRWPSARVIQFWGDLDRTALRDAGVAFWPISPPTLGHMGVMMSAAGPDPVVRLQTGGLKAAEWALAGAPNSDPAYGVILVS